MRTAKEKTKPLDDRGRLLYVIQDNFCEILQCSPWLMDEAFDIRAHGADEVDLADFACRMQGEIGIIYPREVLSLSTIGELLTMTESLLPADFDYKSLDAPFVVPVV